MNGLMMKRLKGRLRCFTLTELLVVITIMVVVLGIGVSNVREFRGTAIFQMGASEMQAALRRVHKATIRNGIPTVMTLQVDGVGVAQGYLQVSAGDMTEFIDFEGYDGFGVQTRRGENIAFNDITLLTEGYSGMAFANSFNVNSTLSSNAVYFDFYIKNCTGTGDLIELGTGGKMVVDEGEASVDLTLSGNSVTFPDMIDRPYLGDETWNKCGLLVHKVGDVGQGHFFFNGYRLGASPVGDFGGDKIAMNIAASNRGQSLDNLAVYSYENSEVVLNDLKGGFFVSNYISSGNLTKQIVLNGEGALINSSSGSSSYTNKESDFIAYASVGLQCKIDDNDADNAGLGDRVSVTGAKSGYFPENGYFVAKDDEDFELVRYSDFSGGSFKVVARNEGSSSSELKDDVTIYYCIPTIFDAQGKMR